MTYEVELKYPLIDPGPIRVAIESLGGRAAGRRRQIDRYFNHPQRDFARTDEALRIRSDADENRITYKGPKIDASSKTRREIELPIGAGATVREQMASLLTALGFQEVFSVAKTRELFAVERSGMVFEIAVDSVDGLGWFVEIEGSADADSLDSVREAALGIAGELGLVQGERRSYLEMLLAIQGS